MKRSAPATEVALRQTKTHLGGAGEPGMPPAMPARGTAPFDLARRRARVMPFMHS
ncbi:hypothetical protein ACFMPD_12580 [Sedimentitalea sp. HM32M-2]|uniref:hypothetical protein n=1 Tax=Sedimentitalea sp. HM32M-2 TaxID=3351566 RepID=UPI00362F8E7C